MIPLLFLSFLLLDSGFSRSISASEARISTTSLLVHMLRPFFNKKLEQSSEMKIVNKLVFLSSSVNPMVWCEAIDIGTTKVPNGCVFLIFIFIPYCHAVLFFFLI